MAESAKEREQIMESAIEQGSTASVPAIAPLPSRPAPPLRLVPPGETHHGLNTPPPGRWLDLGRRGRTWVREHPGPEGAPTLVMLHGLGATGGLNWAGSQLFLGDQFRIVTIDHRGHGRGIRTRDFSLEDCADDTAACIAALGISRPLLVGYSMGGPVASLVWRRYPDLIGGLVLAATSASFVGWPGEKLYFTAMGLAGKMPCLLPDQMIRRFGSLVASIPMPQPGPVKDARWTIDELARHDPRSIVQATAAVGRFDSSSWIADVDVPVAVVVTTDDRVVPASRQFRLARSIPHASVHAVDAGHLCVGGGQPKVRFLTALRSACLEVAGT
jgi:3-oxoadipate enol-lactonase